jgi:hypothetical protein
MSPDSIREPGDDEILELVRACIRRGKVQILRLGSANRKAASGTLELRRLVTRIEKQTGGKLPCRKAPPTPGRLRRPIATLGLRWAETV